MAAFFAGGLGAILVLGVFVAGIGSGWTLRQIWDRYRRPELQKPKEEELRQMAEQQKAFHQLQNYSAERAYGMVEEYR